MNDKDMYIDPKAMDFAEVAVSRLLAEYPSVKDVIKADELKDELHDHIIKADDHIKKQARYYGPLHFVTNFIKNTAKYAALSAALIHGAAEMPNITQDDVADAGQDDGGTAQIDIDSTTARKEYEIGEEEQSPDGKHPVPPPHKPTLDEKKLIAIYEKCEDLLERWFKIHHKEASVDRFDENIRAAITAVKNSPANAPKNGGPEAFYEMFNGTFNGQTGQTHITRKLYEIRTELAAEMQKNRVRKPVDNIRGK
jgi:hypothetical protein